MSPQLHAIHGLPVPLTPLIGRQREVEEVSAVLRGDGVRLLTLTGSGGVGKTRLAIAVAAAVLNEFPDGVVGVPLGRLTDTTVLAASIANAVGVREAGGRPLAAQLASSLRDRTMLLVLDGLEGVARDAGLLPELLAECPGLKILVTSRVVLHVTAEHLYEVLPLSQAGTGTAAGASPGMPDALQLFAQRARAATAAFSLTAENEPAITEICRRLDGLPLAIELAAARIRHFAPGTLLARLERRLPLLTDGPRDAPAHQRTLTATISWSHDLLEEPERRLLRSIAVFAGGCTLEAAMRVGDAQEASLLTLVDHSLLRRFDASGGEARFVMLDTVREFALDRLAESGEWETVRGRHAMWCLDLVTPAEAAIGTGAQQQWIVPIEMEHANLRAAMQMAKDAGDGETLARLAGGLWPFWYARGFLTEGRGWLADALAMVGERTDLRLKLLIGSGALAHVQADDVSASRALGEALDLGRAAGEPRTLSLALTLLGAVARDRGDYGRSEALLQEGLERARMADDAWASGMALNALAILHERRGEFDRAAAVLQESAALAEASSDIWGKVHAISNMAHLRHRLGEFEQASSLYEQGAALYREIGDRRGEANALTNLGRIAERLGDLDRAVDLHSQSLEVTHALGDRRGTATALANRGVAHLRRGDLGHAGEDLRESLAIRFDTTDREGIATCLEKLSEVAIARGRAERGVRLWATSAALRDAIGAPLAPSERASYDVVMAAARSMLGDATVAELWACGREDTIERAVRSALDGDLEGTSPPAVVASRPEQVKGPATGLTPRELEVLRLLEEHTDREIADALSIGPRTVATHVTNILNKLGVNTRTAAVASAIRHGLI